MRYIIFLLLITASIFYSNGTTAQTPELAAVERHIASGRSNAMPINESTITRYFNASEYASSQVTVAEINRAENDPALRRVLMHRVIVAPIENMGFNFDDTMQFIAWSFLTENYTHQAAPMLISMIIGPAQAADILAEMELVTPATYQLLQQFNENFL